MDILRSQQVSQSDNIPKLDLSSIASPSYNSLPVQIHEINDEDIVNAFHKLKPKYSVGQIVFHLSIMLKRYSNCLIQPQKHIFKFALCNNIVPEMWN